MPESHSRNLVLINFLPAFLLGFIATSFQIILLREFAAYFYGNELTFGLVLASWLLWGGWGSVAASRFKSRPGILPKTFNLAIFFFPLTLIGIRSARFLLGLLPGELTSAISIFLVSLVICFLISFPLGALFVFNVNRAQGRIGQVYILESLGAAAAGLAVQVVLLPVLSSWQAAGLIGILGLLLMAIALEGRENKILLLIPLLALIVVAVLDLPSQKIYWKPFRLVAGKDSRYGKLQIIKTGEQISLYSNGLRIYSYPDLASAEESVHFALLQGIQPKSVLLIGGGIGGGLREILKYPAAMVDYVELDPEIIGLSERYLADEERAVLADDRVHFFFEDGRAFLQAAGKIYDHILVNLPDPATAQINRFYTREFFLLVRQKLTAQGVFSFSVSSAENYIGPELQQFLASLYQTLASVFPEIEVVPGERNIFLASLHPLSLDPEGLCQKIEDLGLRTTYVSRQFLFSRLHPLRRSYLEEKLKSGKPNINLDLTPVSFFFQAVLWSKQFKSSEAKVLMVLSAFPVFWLLDIPLVLAILILGFLVIRRKKEAVYLAPLVVLGLTTIVVEIILLVWFQALYGYLYGRIAVLFSTFMFGLFGGSWTSTRIKKASLTRMIVIQGGFLMLLFLIQAVLESKPPEALAYLFFLLLGYLGGELFIISNRLYLEHKADYGLGYGLDLAGSFLGALVTSSLLIPLAGLSLLLRYLILLNSFSLIFVLAGLRRLR